MKNKCYRCKFKFTSTHHDDGTVTFCNFEVDGQGCDMFAVARNCRNCKHLDYSDRRTCHSEPRFIASEPRRMESALADECAYFEGYGIVYEEAFNNAES